MGFPPEGPGDFLRHPPQGVPEGPSDFLPPQGQPPGDPLGLYGSPLVPPGEVWRGWPEPEPRKVFWREPPAPPRICRCGNEATSDRVECHKCVATRQLVGRLTGAPEAQGACPDDVDWAFAVGAGMAPRHTHISARGWISPEQDAALLYHRNEVEERLWHCPAAGVLGDGRAVDLWLDCHAHLYAAGADAGPAAGAQDGRYARYLVEAARTSLTDWPRQPSLKHRSFGPVDPWLPRDTAQAWTAEFAVHRPRRGLRRGPAQAQILDVQVRRVTGADPARRDWPARALQIAFASFDIPDCPPKPDR